MGVWRLTEGAEPGNGGPRVAGTVRWIAKPARERMQSGEPRRWLR